MNRVKRRRTRKQRSDPATQVAPNVLAQLARLFGSDSSEAKMESRSPAQWRSTLRCVLRELSRYLDENIETDDVHLSMLYSGLAMAYDALKATDFWPGYVEGITRLALVLMGDYPDHRKRKGGRKQENHYRLSGCRTLHYTQTSTQKLHTLIAASSFGPVVGINLSKGVFDALREFRNEVGYKPGHKEFIRWYRKKYPLDYGAVF